MLIEFATIEYLCIYQSQHNATGIKYFEIELFASPSSSSFISIYLEILYQNRLYRKVVVM